MDHLKVFQSELFSETCCEIIERSLTMWKIK